MPLMTMFSWHCFPAGQFFRNTNWFMTGVVLAWVAITVAYVYVRAAQSLAFKHGVEQNPRGLLAYGIWVLIVEVGSCTHLLQATGLAICFACLLALHCSHLELIVTNLVACVNA